MEFVSVGVFANSLGEFEVLKKVNPIQPDTFTGEDIVQVIREQRIVDEEEEQRKKEEKERKLQEQANWKEEEFIYTAPVKKVAAKIASSKNLLSQENKEKKEVVKATNESKEEIKEEPVDPYFRIGKEEYEELMKKDFSSMREYFSKADKRKKAEVKPK